MHWVCFNFNNSFSQIMENFGGFRNPFGWKVQLFFVLYWVSIPIITATAGKFGISGMEAVFPAPINAGISEEIAFRTLPLYVDLAMSIGLGVAGLYLVRPAVWNQIVAVWNQKYSSES